MLHQIALTMTKGVGITTLRNLLSQFGSAEEVFSTRKAELEKVSGVSPRTAAAILDKTAFDRAEQELRFIEKYKIELLFITEKHYPKRLKHCVDAPPLLYFKGSCNFNQSKVIAVVGTRNATAYGREFCDQLLFKLKEQQVLVVSGLAYGIDIAAHKSALQHQMQTVGVLGHGLDRIYPAAHRNVAEKMLNQGGLLSEFPSQTNPDRQNFPKRNRIIAGLADATLVVEATKTGGALITAEIANSYNRDVFAVPGRVNDEYAEGCNFLIKTNRAHLLTSAEDLEYIMGWTFSKVHQTPQQLELLPDLSKTEMELYQLIKEKGEMAIDELQFDLDMVTSKLAMLLLNLEMKSLIISLPGKVYKAI